MENNNRSFEALDDDALGAVTGGEKLTIRVDLKRTIACPAATIMLTVPTVVRFLAI